MRQRVIVLVLLATCQGSIAVAGQAPRSPADDFVARGAVEALPAPVERALAELHVAALKARIGFLASPALEGRGLGSRGLDAAAEYVAAAVAEAGIPPLKTDDAAPAMYFQSVPLREISSPAGEVAVERRDGAVVRRRAFVSGVDVLFAEAAPGSLTAPAAFTGYGIKEPALGRDDYRGVDVAGRIVVVLDGLPPGPEWHTAELESRYAADEPGDRYDAKLETAARAGAVAVVVVQTAEALADSIKNDSPAERYYLPGDGAPRRAALPLVRVSPSVAQSLLGEAHEVGTTGTSDNARPLPGVTVTLTLTGTERAIAGRNVVAVISGSDPMLREEAVVVGAHMDHLGIVDGAIHPGADDNASGVAALLEIAKALAASPERPKRTVVVAFWTGEEEGKLGSGHYVRHPLWPLGRTAAYVNLDMVGHHWTMDEIGALVRDSGCGCADAFLPELEPSAFVEPGLADYSDALEPALRRAARGLGVALHLDRSSGRQGGSDYRDFARAGVPFVRFFGDFFAGYHEPADTPDRLDVAAVQQQARLALATAWLLADR